jgi:hypothetical protein
LFAIGHDLNIGIDLGDSVLGGIDFRFSDPGFAVHHLALQIRAVHQVEIDDSQFPHPGRGEVEAERGTEPARADQENTARQEFLLSFQADFADQVAAVTFVLLGVRSMVKGVAIPGKRILLILPIF